MKLLDMLLPMILLPALVLSDCPYLQGPPASMPNNLIPTATFNSPEYLAGYKAALDQLDWAGVKKDIAALLTSSQPFWPADFGNYGPLFIRQAWHCAGSYRANDGRGGCDGGRQRFDPEQSWDDNTNLDKSKQLLWPIKEKYGLGLSWGDLIALAGTVAIEQMGGPVLGFCGGRIDDPDGTASLKLGPTPEQLAYSPCSVNGNCTLPLATTTVGLIYLNPEGPMGVPDPAGSALQVRDAFGRMGLNDTETVALIGGGHAFGKTHGACPKGAGLSPMLDPANPWPGLCGTGKGVDTFTSGFEGPWSTTPTKWGNKYFHALVNNTWQVGIGPGGKHQWHTVNGTQGIMMLTADISLLHDPAYQSLVQHFANDLGYLNTTFAAVWYKLLTRDMGPVTRCAGPYVPPPQDFQFALPPTPTTLPNFSAVKAAIISLLRTSASNIMQPDVDSNGNPYYGAAFVQLAWQCASTFRATDYKGGCNGARIRFSPEKDWPVNAGMNNTLQILQPVKTQFGDNLSWADLIVLAGTTALEQAGNINISFCGGRTDALNGAGSQNLRSSGGYSSSLIALQDSMEFLALSRRELVALSGRLRSPVLVGRQGFQPNTWTSQISSLSNSFYTTLLSETWVNYTVPTSGNVQYVAQGTNNVFMLPSDLNLKYQAEFRAVVLDFAANNTMFLNEFAAAWTKLMNIDRFDGPTRNLCDPPASSQLVGTPAPSVTPKPGTSLTGRNAGERTAVSMVAIVVIAALSLVAL